MFANIAHFFIKNSKLTFVLVLVSLLVGIGSYFILPKQYNPTIIVPAFQIQVPAYGLQNDEVSRKIVTPLENLLMEIEGIDEVYGYAYDNFAGVMAKFEVGVENEAAKIRIIQKINENLAYAEHEIQKPQITAIDPEELSQITYAISYTGEKDALSSAEKQMYLRQIAYIIKNDVKTVDNVTTMQIVGGLKKNIVISLDIDKITARNTDILQVYDALKKYNINAPSGDIVTGNEKIFVSLEAKAQTIEALKKVVLSNISGSPLYLGDVADISYGSTRLKQFVHYTDEQGKKETVLLGFGKKRGTNAVFITEKIQERIENIAKKLPKDVQIELIQNEGQTAKKATNMLLTNLFQSFIIVFIVLAFYLGVKNALNTAVSIPLTLALVFFSALILGDNINKITLFALILVLGMIVDNSTVVVENVSRHLSERHTNESKIQAVLNGVSEVGFGVVMATVTRLLAFGSMFAVGGMMGSYMGPIPKYAIIALLLSLVISLTINPWLSYFSAKEVSEKDRKIPEKHKKFDPRKWYLELMKIFLGEERKQKKNRKIFKLFFWLSLFAVILAPIYLGIFKARMLPKSNQNQIYVWIDAPRSTSAQKMQEIETQLTTYFFQNSKLPVEQKMVKNISSSIGTAFMGDFANLFRGGLQRIGENQISARLNLYHDDEFEEKFGIPRMNSEAFTIALRNGFKNYLLEKYPDLQIRLQEDPPGPPVMSTFRIKLKSEADAVSLQKFLVKTEQTVEKIAPKYGIVDIGNSESSTYRKLQFKIDTIAAAKAGITTEQITATMGIIFSDYDIGSFADLESYEQNSLLLSIKPEQKNSLSSLQNIVFTNLEGKKIPLTSIAKISYSFVGDEIQTDKREETKIIYGEMGDNSLVYPVIQLFKIFLSDEFTGKEFQVESWNPYGITYRGLADGNIYKLEWGGEWELTVDTFRDLGIAMMISLLAIYFLLVGQFASFAVAGIIMVTFLLSFFGVFPGFTVLYLLKNEYFSATSMIGIIALGGIVVGNAIILIDYLTVLKKNKLCIKDALLKAGYVRFAPIILTSLTTVFGAATIIGDPVWSGLAWTIIWGLFFSSILTLIVVPIFYYDSQKEEWEKE